MSSVWSKPLLAFYLIYCIISLMGSLFVAISISRFGASTLSSRLVLYLHYSQIIQDIMAIPYIWWYNPAICQIAGFLHIYSGLANIICVLIMVIAYRDIFFPDEWKVRGTKICEWCLNYLSYLVFGLPLIAVLCFSTNSYGQVSNNLCSYHQHKGVALLWGTAFGVFAVFVFCFCIYTVVKTIYDVYIVDKVIGAKLFKTLVFYAFATFVFWTPRTVFQFIDVNNEAQVSSNIMIFTAGILYSLIFLQEKSSLKSFEEQQNQTNNDVLSVSDSNNSFSMSFTEDDPDRISRSSNAPSVVLRGFANNATENPLTQSINPA